jgi:3-isopropylmalate/(R)-2-methylmalate dehydratase small subunit
MNWTWKGRAWVFGDDIPNDNGLVSIDFVRRQEYAPAVLAKHAFADIDPELAQKIAPGDLILAGKNFGRGNPHVQGFLALKGLQVAVVAESMQRGPLRACVNAGVPLLTPAPGLKDFAESGNMVCVNFETGSVTNVDSGQTLHLSPLPPLMREIVAVGGGLMFMKQRLSAQSRFTGST